MKWILTSTILAAALPAQAVTAITRTAIQVEATAGGQRTARSIPARTNVSTGFFLSASQKASGRWGTCVGSGWSHFTRSRNFAEFKNEAYATFPIGCPASSTVGENAIEVIFRANHPVAGKLYLLVQGSVAGGNQSKWSGAIDVGDDGKFELTGAGQATYNAVVGPKGLSVILRGAAATTYAEGKSLVSARFLPQVSRFGVEGSPCGGPAFESLYTGKLLRLQVSQIPTGRFGLLAIGTTDPNLVLPPRGCLLRTDILVGIGMTPRNGEVRLDIPITAPPPAGTFRMQFLIAGNSWLTSNAVTITP